MEMTQTGVEETAEEVEDDEDLTQRGRGGQGPEEQQAAQHRQQAAQVPFIRQLPRPRCAPMPRSLRRRWARHQTR